MGVTMVELRDSAWSSKIGGEEEFLDEGDDWQAWLEESNSGDEDEPSKDFAEVDSDTTAVDDQDFAEVDSETAVPIALYERMLLLAQGASGQHKVTWDGAGAARLVLAA
uniref:Uncharacterized protein n=1 Tax=Alexandrium catenella TaxID=2925 RepID=A0A7S1RFT1_ALECA